tara:strand:+ start:20848 stop:21645 length:798 start_codon:yes stop_codon:yes gene_type:complete
MALATSEILGIKVLGENYTDLPKDLYIPPEALEVVLETFEGPLDLLLFLIKKHNLDILDIPVFEITRQYMQYISFMDSLKIELAAEYLSMAAILAEIKSRLLLPKLKVENEEEEDPRAELIRKLKEYERFKEVSEKIDDLPRVGRDIYISKISNIIKSKEVLLPKIDTADLLAAMYKVIERADNFAHHMITPEKVSLRDKMTNILQELQNINSEYVEFSHFFKAKEGKVGIVVTIMAILELSKDFLIEVIQNQAFAPIYLKLKQS